MFIPKSVVPIVVVEVVYSRFEGWTDLRAKLHGRPNCYYLIHACQELMMVVHSICYNRDPRLLNVSF